MDGTNSVKVSVYGEIYSLVSDESEQHLLKTAHRVDLMMKEIADATGIQDAKRLAVLVALRLTSSMILAEEQVHISTEQYEKISHKIDRVLSSY